MVHGDTVGAEALRRSLCGWARDLHLLSARGRAELDGYVGYFEPYATSHEAIDGDTPFQKEVANAILTLIEAIEAARAGRLVEAGTTLENPRPK